MVYFDVYSEHHFHEFRCKKFEQRIKDQTKDDDVQSDNELVGNTRYQVLSNTKKAIEEFSSAKCAQDFRAVED